MIRRRQARMRRKERTTGWTLAFSFSFVLVLSLWAVAVHAEYPERQISVLNAFDPGSPSDLITRASGIGAEKALGKPLVFENKAGGGGSVAISLLATTKPDGYTLSGAPNVAVVDTALMQKVTYKPLKSFTPIVGLARAEHTALLVKADAPWKTAQEFFAYAKANPGKIKYSSSGVGTGMHVVMEYIAAKEGIKWVFVPYKGGPASRAALMGGHVNACSSAIDWPPQVLSGDLRVLATHGYTRSPAFPNVPTMIELGYDVTNDTIHGIFAPAGVPPDIVAKLEAAFAKGMETPEFKTTRERLYLSPISMNSKQFEQHLKEYWAKEEKMLKDVGVIKEPATQPY
jgi:tripartite-type tricarboxylate transporter receptor subunit TctC